MYRGSNNSNLGSNPVRVPSPRVYATSNKGSSDSSDLLGRRLEEVARTESLEAAMKLKQILSENNLNVVTSESLTAGMIAKTLVDIPGNGNVVYGGFVVYDTDAKRKFNGVTTKGVYSILTAQQMAAGALERSRAMVAIAVTGDSMPLPKDKDNIGFVYIGIALRLSDRIYVSGKEISICELKQVTNMCDSWKDLNQTGYAPYQYTAILSDYIRMRTVTEACNEARYLIQEAIDKRWMWGLLPQERYDYICSPSSIIKSRVYPKISNIISDCQGNDASLLIL